MMTSTDESRNGMRQPYDFQCASDMFSLKTRMTISERKRPIVAVVWMKLV